MPPPFYLFLLFSLLQVDWPAIETRLHAAFDTDGDGQVTMADLEWYYAKMLSILTYNVPSSASFAGAFILGLRYG